MKIIFLVLFAYHIQTQNIPQLAAQTINPLSTSASNLTFSGKAPSANASNGNTNAVIRTINETLPLTAFYIPIKIPSPLNDSVYYTRQSAYTPYHALILQKQKCSIKNPTIIKNLAIRQHNTSYYITSQQYFLSLKKGSPNPSQYFTAVQNIDCSWSFMSKEGFYISLKTAYNYLMLEPTITPTQKFSFKQKSDFLYIQSTTSTLFYWTAINGIGRLGQKQGSRFVLQIWSESKK